jgi:SAM-dependent methyltransferase
VASDVRWLAAVWPFVRGSPPPAPAVVVEIGCGPLGGFVPRLEAAGYSATGIDPEAPQGPPYRQAEFEHSALPGRVDAIVACTSLHHVADLTGVLDLVHAALLPGGTVVVVEWARERFDEATARWCFGRLPEPGVTRHLAWIRAGCTACTPNRRSRGRSWDACLRSWAQAEGLHAGLDILNGLDARFDCCSLGFGPYFFPDLAGTSEAEEQAAIDAGLIKANRIQYAGRWASHIAPSQQ